ncbi:conserved hypothetical protein [Ricinus communis]|uniref:Uncharacterized protein n=1 Tax=Ricinus communis TaxID=3988 RepID=B9T5H0_RICCO|nr:conserved hypothetical protein [Ricinus communis]
MHFRSPHVPMSYGLRYLSSLTCGDMVQLLKEHKQIEIYIEHKLLKDNFEISYSKREIEDLTYETELGGLDLSNEVAATFELVRESNDAVNQAEVGGDLNRRSEDKVKGSVKLGVNSEEIEEEGKNLGNGTHCETEAGADARKALKQFKENKRCRHKAAVGNEDANISNAQVEDPKTNRAEGIEQEEVRLMMGMYQINC